ncbi:hypothetical protein C8R47DRAFT_1079978 [Mycena vitilis]|nr:hypothetical protein C8R47DRAFT_1079978 [Mycena vitilis]
MHDVPMTEPSTWEWPDKEGWNPAHQVYQKFLDYWVSSERQPSLTGSSFPHRLSIFPNPIFSILDLKKLGATPLQSTLNGTILVHERYAFIYDTLNEQRESNYQGGGIIGGQPGIGKSLLKWYILVRLLNDREPVLLYLPGQAPSARAVLFYDGRAWSPNFQFGFQDLPFGPGSKPIFALVDSAATEPDGLSVAAAWPICAVSPTPGRYREFLKARDPAILGLDLWSPEDLRSGLEVHNRWPELKAGIVQYINLRQNTSRARNLDAAISVVQHPAYKNWPKATLEDWISILLDHAVYRWGRVPRNVFQSILGAKSTTNEIILPSDILDIIITFLRRGEAMPYGSSDPISHTIIALQMHPTSLTSSMDSRFVNTLRSGAVAAQVEYELSKRSRTQLEDVYSTLKSLPGGSVLAGHIFADHSLARMCRDGAGIILKPMFYQQGSASDPLFTADRNAAATSTPTGVEPEPTGTAPTTLPIVGTIRQPWYEWNYKHSLPNSLYQRRMNIFVPVAPNHPLFDAFFLEVPNFKPHARTLWLLQFSTRQRHGGDRNGLLNARKLMKIAGHGVTEAGKKIAVKVQWVFVAPKTETTVREWQMPPGWNEGTGNADHRGPVWLQEFQIGLDT